MVQPVISNTTALVGRDAVLKCPLEKSNQTVSLIQGYLTPSDLHVVTA